MLHLAFKVRRLLLFYGLIFLLSFSGCLISINDVNYRYLTKKQRQHFVPFDSNTFDMYVNNSPDSFLVQEITADDLKKLIKLHEYTCVFIWPDWCGAEGCQNLHLYEDLEKAYLKDFRIIIVTPAYDYPEIRNILKQTEYHHQLYVVKYNPRYGNNILRVNDGFTYDLIDTTFTGYRHNYFMFKGDSLIYIGDFCNRHVLDSIFAKN